MTNALVVALAMSLVVVQDVSAHGYVNGIVIDGETVYPGNAPGHYTSQRPKHVQLSVSLNAVVQYPQSPARSAWSPTMALCRTSLI